MERMGLSMTKPDPIMIAVANFNNWYKKEKVRIAKSKRKKLKNITPKEEDSDDLVTELEQLRNEAIEELEESEEN